MPTRQAEEATLRGVAGLAMSIAVAAPMLLAFNLSPSPTFLNQALAHGLWGTSMALLALAGTFEHSRRSIDGARSLIASFALIAVCIAVPVAWSELPMPIALSMLATLASAMLVACVGAEVRGQSRSTSVYSAFLWGVLGAGVLSSVISLVQVFAPSWSGGDLIARSGLPGRAVGNLRQPNHLASLLLWSAIAALGLLELRRLTRAAAATMSVLLIFGVVLSGSRTGALGALVMGAWGLADKRLSKAARILLMATPFVYALAWSAMWAWAHGGDHAFGAQRSLTLSGGDISSSRFGIWSNAWTLITHEPLLGTGLGEFNLAWTLTRLPDRPVAFFDHTHNLPLQLIVELGWPLATAVLALLLFALLRAWRCSWLAVGEQGVAQRTSFMLVVTICLHSLLEYPLWYAYFLLPTSFAWGYVIAAPIKPHTPTPAEVPRAGRAWTVVVIGWGMALGAAVAVVDYYRVAIIYEPPTHAAPLEERIARGQRSLLFAHHADYAAATAFGEPKAPLSESQVLAFRRAPHHLLDIRLMIAWSQALAAQGEVDKARWLAARIREFRNPGADEYFEPCANPTEAAQAFQCQPPQRSYHWREFVER